MNHNPSRSLMAMTMGSILCCVLPCRAEPGPPTGKDMRLFLLAGQSNMAGRGKLDDQSKLAHPRVWVLARDLSWKPAVDPLHYDKPAAGTGIGKPFAEILAKQDPEIRIGLIPAACGGSPISAWEPGVRFQQTSSHPYDDAVARAKAAMKSGTLQAILWHQGESDANEALAPAYEEKLRALITRFRKDLDSPELPFLIGQLGQFGKWNAATAQVDQAQQNVAKSMKNVYFIRSDKLTTGDGIHFDTASLRIMAERYAEAWLKRR